MNQSVVLSWPKAKDGYRIELPDDGPANNGFCAFAFSGEYLELEKTSASYEAIVPRNRRTEVLTLELDTSNVLFDLANALPTPEGVRQFADQWGLLQNTAVDPDESEHVDQFYRASSLLWLCLLMMSADRWSELSEFTRGWTISAGWRRLTGAGQLVIYEADDLLNFCFLQLFTMIERKAEIFRCPVCHRYSTKIRTTRRTCSSTCKTALHKIRSKRQRQGHSDKLDIAKQFAIGELHRSRTDLLISSTYRRAFISSECRFPDIDEQELLELFAGYLIDRDSYEVPSLKLIKPIQPEGESISATIRARRSNASRFSSKKS